LRAAFGPTTIKWLPRCKEVSGHSKLTERTKGQVVALDAALSEDNKEHLTRSISSRGVARKDIAGRVPTVAARRCAKNVLDETTALPLRYGD
jgi:hypothetical protein